MSLFDYHVHTDFSFDCTQAMIGYAKAAEDFGISEICFTEHTEAGHSYGEYAGWDGFFDVKSYFHAIDSLNDLYPNISFKKGVEAGLTPDSIAKTREFVEKNSFDFVIASQHIIDGVDPYDAKDYYNGDIKKTMSHYLKEIYNNAVKFQNFDVIAHIGYAARYAPFEIFLEYSDYSDILDSLFNYLVSNGKGIELNTSGFKSAKEPNPSFSIIKRFFELGGEVVTIGSDSHSAAALGFCFDKAKAFLKDAGAKYVCTFKNRKPVFNSL